MTVYLVYYVEKWEGCVTHHGIFSTLALAQAAFPKATWVPDPNEPDSFSATVEGGDQVVIDPFVLDVVG